MVHMSLLSGYHKYFKPIYKSRQKQYKTCRSQADVVLLEFLHFASSVCKWTKHFGLSFAHDAPKISNYLHVMYV